MNTTTTTITFASAEAVREEKRHLSARSGLSALWWAMRRGMLAARESRNELPWLAPEKARELFDRWLRGEWAQPQWAWELMEKYDETLFAVKRARLAALNEMPWQVVVDADAVGEDAARQALAEAQRQKLVELLGNVENLRAALTHLGMADFRGIAALELTGNEERMRWEVIEPWLLCRPNLAGPVMYNERAEDTPAHPELLERERVILRTAEPIDLPAMFLLTAKHHGTQAWDAFLDTFGIPSIFLETPPNTTEEQAREYQAKVEEIVGEGRGTIPSGAKFHTVETGQKETKSFQERADWCKNALLILATGGLLTITAQSGSGTLAGNAHADSFERLCAATAQDISAVVDFQFCRPALQNIFPGQPILAHFELAPEKEDDLAAQAQIIATLAAAGFKPSAEVVSEMMGFEVAAVEQQPDLPLTNDHRPMINSAASQHVMNRKETPASGSEPNSINGQLSMVNGQSPEVPPLTEDELAAFATLATPNPARMAQRQREVEAALRAAADLPEATAEPVENSESDGEECRAKDPSKCRTHGKNDRQEREMERSSMESAGYSKEEIERELGKEPRRRMTDAQAADVAAFKKDRKNIKASIKQSIPEHGGLELDMAVQELKGAVLTRNAIGEMLSDKAVRASVLNGCPTSAHVEAVSRASELASTAKKVGEEPGRKENDKVEKITHLEKTFSAKDGNKYIAHFTAHHPKPNPQQPDKPAGPPKIYFLYLRK